MSHPQTLQDTLGALRRENETLRTEAAHATLMLQALESLLCVEQEDDPFAAVFASLQTVFDFDQALVMAQRDDHDLDCIAAIPPAQVGLSWRAGTFFKRVMDGRVSTMFCDVEIEEWRDPPPGLSPDQPALYLPIRVRDQRGVLALLRAAGRPGFDHAHFALARKFALLASHALAAREANRTEAELSSKRQLEIQNIRFNAALNNMCHALVMFDAAARLVVWNEHYVEMYRLPRHSIKAGIKVHELLKYLADAGAGPSDHERYGDDLLAALAQGRTVERVRRTTDGRTIRITNQPMADGGWVGIHEDISERVRAEQQVAHMAHHDMLTGLPNRVLFYRELDRALARVGRGERIAVLYLDLDHFKRINDTLGHLIGDELLRQAAERLRGCVRTCDLIARLGGDEFAVLQSLQEPSDAAALATRIGDAMKAPFDLDGQSAVVGVSIGISVAPDDADARDQLLKNADLALYDAKDNGRGACHFYAPELNERMKARQRLDADLGNALERGEFELHYQPVLDLGSQFVVGCEALLRWRHPARGLLSPAGWIPAAEESGLIIALGEWVLRRACAEAVTWSPDIRIAVNLSPVQFRAKNLLATIVDTLGSTGLAAHRLELEITEAALMEHNDLTLDTLHQLRRLGVRIALDDFGTGYSSLNYLRSFPFDKIKIDRCFVEHLCDEDQSVAIVRAITGLAGNLHMVTTAEGVETAEQLAAVRALGCTEMQGFLLSRPLPAADVARLCGASVQRAAWAA